MNNITKQIVVLDTNIIFNHWFLDTPYFEILKKVTELGIFEVYIPEVVYLEVKANYRKQLREYFKYKKIQTMTKKLELSITSPKQIYQNYEKFLERKIANSFFHILKMDNHINIRRLIIKCIEGKKPFKTGSEKGCKDELIWQLIVNRFLSQGHKVYFITKNTTDFCQNSQLHPDLQNDLDELSIPIEYCKIYTSLQSFVNEQIPPYFEKAKEFIEEFNIEDWLLSNIHKLTNEITIDCDQLVYKFNLETPELDSIAEIKKVSIEDAYHLDNDFKQIFISGIAETEAVIDAFIFKSDYYLLDIKDNSILCIMDNNWNEHYVWIQLFPKATLEFSLIMDIKTKKMMFFEGTLVCDETYDYCKHCSAPIYSDSAELCPECGKNLF